MSRFLTLAALVLAVVSIALSGRLWQGSRDSMTRMSKQAAAAEQQIVRLRKELAEIQTAAARAQVAIGGPPVPAPTGDADPSAPAAPAPEAGRPKEPEQPVTTNLVRDVLINIEQCTLTNRSLRCTFNVTNQSGLEKKFALGVGGSWSRFDSERGGASFFDDLGNDFLSIGGSIANRNIPNCDGGSPCELEKFLSPGVKTPAWIRFDGVDPNLSSIKLFRLKWTDGSAWVPVDFRHLPVTR